MKPAARLVLLVGVVAIGLVLFRAAPRDVTFVYDVARVPGATAIQVEIRRGAETLRRAEIRVPAGETQVRHPVRLPPGTYEVSVEVDRPDAVIRTTRTVDVRESGPILVPVGP